MCLMRTPACHTGPNQMEPRLWKVVQEIIHPHDPLTPDWDPSVTQLRGPGLERGPGEADRAHTDRQTDRQSHRQTNSQTDRESVRLTRQSHR